MYPDWVEKYHTKGTSIKLINGTYYLYNVTSKRVKDKAYPVSIQKYIGKITKEGLIEPEKISFIPSVDNIVILGNIVDVDNKDKAILSDIAAIEHNNYYYCGKLSNKEINTIKKYFNYDEGKIWAK